jgi:hypothetical protein
MRSRKLDQQGWAKVHISKGLEPGSVELTATFHMPVLAARLLANELEKRADEAATAAQRRPPAKKRRP